MPVHHFTLIVEGTDLQADPKTEALFEAGCDDATVGRSNGVQYIAFDREAESLAEAVHSAQPASGPDRPVLWSTSSPTGRAGW